MDPETIENLIKSNLPDSEVSVTGDGRHFEAFIVSSVFEGMSLIQRQRRVYESVGQHLREGSIHALSIKAKTPSEYQQEKK